MLFMLRGLMQSRSGLPRHRRRSNSAAAEVSHQGVASGNSFFQPMLLDPQNRMRRFQACVARPFSHHYLLVFGRGFSEEALTALCMAMHPRLGVGSFLGAIQADILRAIASLAAR